MSKHRSITVIETGLRDHPATAAWNAVQAEQVEPTRIVALKNKQHSSVFRLDGVGPDGATSIIAKRSTLGSLLLEQAIYEQVLALLPLRTLRCYGFLRNDDSVSGWLFLEDAGNGCYSAEIAVHRVLAANWLGTAHTSASVLPNTSQLPDRGPVFFRELLFAGSARIRQSLERRDLRSEDRGVLKAILPRLAIVAAHWGEVEKSCERAPKTLIHGDLKSRNLRVCECGSGPVLFPLDWEVGGWATPAVDLYFVEELEVYREAVRDTWPHLSLDDLKQLRFCGRILRLAASVYWAAANLEHLWLERTMPHLELYSARLHEAIRIAGWGG